MKQKTERQTHSRRGWWAIPVFVVFVALVALIATRPIENLARDLMMSSISPFTDPPDKIVLVSITEQTLDEFPYRSPIDRSFLAVIVERIASANPKVIGIDLLFDQGTDPAKDLMLEEVISRSKVPIVIASAEAEDGLSQRQVEFLAGFAKDTERGLATLARDPIDGVVRELFAGRQEGAEFRPGFATAIARAGGELEPHQLPRWRRAMVYYRTPEGEPHAFANYPAETVPLLPPAWFADKYVLIGVDLPLEDRHLTSFVALNGVLAGTLPGVAIHAHGLAQILSGDVVVPAGIAGAAIVFLCGLALASWIAWRPLPVLFKPPLIVLVLVAMWVVSGYVFSRWGVYIPVVGPSILVAGLAGLAAFLAWKRDREHQRFLKKAFSQYVSPAVVKDIVDHPDSLRLGGERRVITCIFTDLQGFTSLSERLQPEEIASVLNEYLDRVCNLFVDHGATIDKVIGDAVVGFFGAPADQPDQADRAVRLAVAIDAFSEQFRGELAQKGHELGITRVGVHSGPAIVGNFGGERFFDYTAIGDTVNTAARLEGANKYVNTRICISGAVAEKCRNAQFRPSGTIYLKGKAQGIDAFEPVGLEEAQSCAVRDYVAAYDKLQAGNRGARTAFAKLARKYPEDRLVQFHHKRLENGEKGTDIILSEK